MVEIIISIDFHISFTFGRYPDILQRWVNEEVANRLYPA